VQRLLRVKKNNSCEHTNVKERIFFVKKKHYQPFVQLWFANSQQIKVSGV